MGPPSYPGPECSRLPVRMKFSRITGMGGGCKKMRLASLRSEPVQRRSFRGSSCRSLSSHKMKSMSNLTTRMVVAMAAQSRRSTARRRRPPKARLCR
jgi:hypothetical protein